MSKLSIIKLKYYTNSFDSVILKNFLKTQGISFINKFSKEIHNKEYTYFLDYEGIDVCFDNDEQFIEFLYEIIISIKEIPVNFSFYFKEISMNILLMNEFEDDVNITTLDIGINHPILLPNINIPDFSYYAEKLLPYFDMENVKLIEFSYF